MTSVSPSFLADEIWDTIRTEVSGDAGGIDHALEIIIARIKRGAEEDFDLDIWSY